MQISLRPNIKQLERTLNDFARKQLPFAAAKALTAVTKIVQKAEQDNLDRKLDRPTPFTKNSIRVMPATKASQEAVLFVQDIAAAYLAPYEFGGANKLNGRALLKPVALSLNSFGNMPRSKLAQLKARPDVFVGTVKTKSGESISGVWQRPTNTAAVSLLNHKGKRLRGVIPAGKGNATGHMKLLIRFTDAHPVKQRLGYRALAEQLIRKHFNKEMGRALAQAIATAK